MRVEPMKWPPVPRARTRSLVLVPALAGHHIDAHSKADEQSKKHVPPDGGGVANLFDLRGKKGFLHGCLGLGQRRQGEGDRGDGDNEEALHSVDASGYEGSA